MSMSDSAEISPPVNKRPWVRPLIVPATHAAVAAGIGLIAGVFVSFQQTAGMGTSFISHVGRAATGIATGFSGKLDVTFSTYNGSRTVAYEVFPWPLALLVLVALWLASRFTQGYWDRQGSNQGHRWRSTLLTGAIFTVLVLLLNLLPARTTLLRYAVEQDVSTNLWLTALVLFPLATLASAAGAVHTPGGRRDPGRLGLRTPSWLGTPLTIATWHVVWAGAVALMVTTAHALQYAVTRVDLFFMTSWGPHAAINTGVMFGGIGKHTLPALTPAWLETFNNTESVSQAVGLSEYPGAMVDSGQTLTLFTGRPVWVNAPLAIAAIIGVLAAAVALRLRRPRDEGQWSGLPITLAIYTGFGAVVFLLSRFIETSVKPSVTWLSLTPWSILMFTATALLVEILSRFLAPGLLRLMPGLVRRYGRVPAPPEGSDLH